MALDLYLSETREQIDHHEEYVLVMATAQPRLYPALAGVRQRFYDDPVIGPDDANTIVHELIMLLAANPADRALTHLIVRLLPFFSQSYRTQEPIRCASD